jgi:hypothetical protein
MAPHSIFPTSVAPLSCASVDPVDQGTHFIVSDAFGITLDKDDLLSRLVAACCGRDVWSD